MDKNPRRRHACVGRLQVDVGVTLVGNATRKRRQWLYLQGAGKTTDTVWCARGARPTETTLDAVNKKTTPTTLDAVKQEKHTNDARCGEQEHNTNKVPTLIS